jgi:malonate transporter
MLQILAIISPIFILIAIGYAGVRLGIVSKVHLPGMGAFLLYCAMPALIVRALISRPLGDILNLRYLLAYGAGSIVVFGLGLCLALFVQRRNLQTSAMTALGMSASNSGFVGYPIASLILGPTAGLALALCMVIENILIIPLALGLAEAGSQSGAPVREILTATAWRLISNPILLAILVGIVLTATGVTLPGPLFKAVDMLATASAPVALFVIGGTLVGINIGELGGQVVEIVTGKLLLHPLAVLAFLSLAGSLEPDLKTAAIIMASAPMLSIYPILGQRYENGHVCAAALLVATINSVLTISAAIWMLGWRAPVL